ncbi:hypothetical protein H7I53_18090 [Mycolicibacterium pulveris]|uniref:hypothetical protein n=1 Tax=Mycolicibacterium pulveris TaxID=36813 RepID=UPI0013CF7021|nr:hypothetical protein [Mycolicibacterium pulveris]MCV6982126.1 hypothetical protein [Mycolicibacterium pulveris]
MDGSRVVGISARLQGAELIRADEARRLAVGMDGQVTDEDYRTCYERVRIENHELQDLD